MTKRNWTATHAALDAWNDHNNGMDSAYAKMHSIDTEQGGQAGTAYILEWLQRLDNLAFECAVEFVKATSDVNSPDKANHISVSRIEQITRYKYVSPAQRRSSSEKI